MAENIIKLDDYIDLSGFMSLRCEIDACLARSIWHTSDGRYTDPRLSSQRLINHHVNERPDSEERAYLLPMTPDQRRRFVMLHDHARSMGFYVIARGVKEMMGSKSCELNIIDHPPLKFLPRTWEYVQKLPCFKSLGRLVFFITPPNFTEITHRDKAASGIDGRRLEEFLWFRFDIGKKLFIANDLNGKQYFDGHACWFNSREPHGVDPVDYYTVSMRIDGIFADDFRQFLLDRGAAGPFDAA